MEKRDILDRLIDFESHGNTATERCMMRFDAHNEIKKLRQQLKAGPGAVGIDKPCPKCGGYNSHNLMMFDCDNCINTR